MKIKLFTVPNVITLGNLACGCLSILQTVHYGNLRAAFYFIIAAAVLDFLDGFAARLLKSYSEVGKQLDSLSDMVSFGAAPAFILHSLLIASGCGQAVALSAFLIALFSALRLAKFNIDERQTDSFIGLPTPASALFLSSLGYIVQQSAISLPPWVYLIITVALSYLMVSNIKMIAFKFKNFSFSDNSFRYIFAGISLALAAFMGIAAIPVIIILYIISSVVIHAARIEL